MTSAWRDRRRDSVGGQWGGDGCERCRDVGKDLEELDESGVIHGVADEGQEACELDVTTGLGHGAVKIDEQAHADGRNKGEGGGINDDDLRLESDNPIQLKGGVIEIKAGFPNQLDQNGILQRGNVDAKS